MDDDDGVDADDRSHWESWEWEVYSLNCLKLIPTRIVVESFFVYIQEL